MAEIAFVVKTFFISCLFIFALQYRVDGVSAESKVFDMLHSSRLTGWMKTVGEGAVRLTATTINSVIDPKKAEQERNVAQQGAFNSQLEEMKKHEEEWVKRVDKVVDEGAPVKDSYVEEPDQY